MPSKKQAPTITKMIKEFDEKFVYRGKEGRFNIEEISKSKTPAEIKMWVTKALIIQRDAGAKEIINNKK